MYVCMYLFIYLFTYSTYQVMVEHGSGPGETEMSKIDKIPALVGFTF